MDERTEKLLYDVKMAVDAIRTFCQGKTREAYSSDLLLRSAVERQYEIIGEALTKLRKQDPSLLTHISESEKIIGFRNVLAHAYDVIDDQISWSIIEEKLPILKKEIESLLSNASLPAESDVIMLSSDESQFPSC
jgi:uncharacterized protein with HEPN domain